MTNSQVSSRLDFNASAKVITALFVSLIGVLIVTGHFFGTLFSVTTPYVPSLLLVGNSAEALVGFNASRLFGGGRNFTGRLLLLYSIALVLGVITFLLWVIFVREGVLPTPGETLEFFLAPSIAAHGIAGYALFVSARSLIMKVTRREVGMIIASLIFSLTFSFVTGFYFTSFTIRLVWAGIWSTIIFFQLASGLVVVSRLGKWYVARQIAYVTFGYLGFSVIVPIAQMMQASASSFSLADLFFVIVIVAGTTNYIVGLSMSQIRPMKREVFLTNGNSSKQYPAGSAQPKAQKL